MVGPGSTSSTIEVTMGDEGGKIEGKVEDADASSGGAGTPSKASTDLASQILLMHLAYIYCVPLPDSSGQFTEIRTGEDGKFTSPTMAPGAYRVLAFSRQQQELEYHNPEAMKAYGAKVQIVRIEAGKTQHLQLQLISSSE
jgi:hypothetical protein